ncbi:hypothetical protein HJG60_013277 [Phyllostomus discolor]|uniref:Uncharacterized protein n=1 Tax=Phyllostomus discolor TaxID=89673 RepID=A0A834E265_9CHIR|nr:hypothetical protein HJG60_013277 [Phyllostomus discolor]
MPSPRIVLKKKTRMLGAAQVMIGLFHSALGYTWMYLYRRESEAFLIYLPVVLLSGHPFWASFFYIISGIFAIEAEKKRSPRLLKYTIMVNMHSVVFALIGLLLFIIEIILVVVKQVKIQWPVKSGVTLSVYLCIFSTLEMFLANTVAKWGTQAFQRGSYHT